MLKNSDVVILKFGGTCMGSANSINVCADIIENKIKSNLVPFVVVSAVSKMTDKLILMLELAKSNKKKEFEENFYDFKQKHLTILNNICKVDTLLNKCSNIMLNKINLLYKLYEKVFILKKYTDKIYALVCSYGEDISSDLMELCLIQRKINAKKIHSKHFVKTNGNYLSANVDFKQSKICFNKIKNTIYSEKTVYVMTGFFGSNNNNDIMLLGRGGSDFSASIAGISLETKSIEIWTDADGIMSGDPRIITNAKSWKFINREIATEIAYAGAKVLHPKTISASYYNIDVIIKNLFHQEFEGTLVNSNINTNNIVSITLDDSYSLIHFNNKNILDKYGFIEKINTIFNKNHIFLDIVASSETSISCLIKTNTLPKNTLQLFDKIVNVSIIENVSKISILGNNINNSNILSQIFNILQKEKIDPLTVSIGTSNNNIRIIVKNENKNKTLLCLHQELIINANN